VGVYGTAAYRDKKVGSGDNVVFVPLHWVFMVSIVALRQKTKETISLLFISPRWIIAAGTYTLTIDGLRGAVLQMIAHGL
jgi:NADH-quinone oxidoreductase subunit M